MLLGSHSEHQELVQYTWMMYDVADQRLHFQNVLISSIITVIIMKMLESPVKDVCLTTKNERTSQLCAMCFMIYVCSFVC